MQSIKPPAVVAASDRESPHSDDAERGLLACCIGGFDGSSDCISDAVTRNITPDSFWRTQHQIIWEHTVKLHESGADVTELSVAESINSVGRLNDAGHHKYINEITGVVQTSNSYQRWRDIVLEKQSLRSLIRKAHLAIEHAHNGAVAPELIQETISSLQGITQPTTDHELHTPTTILASETDPNHYLLADGILGCNELTSLVGPGGIGKSRLAVDLAISLAAALDRWMGLALRGHNHRVLFIGSENSVPRLKADLSVLLTRLSAEERQRAMSNIHWFLKPSFLDDARSFAELRQVVTKIQPTLLILDTLASLTIGLDLNADTDMRTAVNHVTQLQSLSPGAACLIIHHARPGSENISAALSNYSGGAYGRNSKVLANLCRAQLNLTPGDAEDRGKLVLSVGKLNNGQSFPAIGIIYDDNNGFQRDDSFDLELYKSNVKSGKSGGSCKPEHIVEVIRDGKHTSEEICQAIKSAGGPSRPTVMRAVKLAVERKMIQPTRPFGSYIVP